jgi:hypothetical protein
VILDEWDGAILNQSPQFPFTHREISGCLLGAYEAPVHYRCCRHEVSSSIELVFGQISVELRCAEGEYEFWEGASEKRRRHGQA